MAYHSTTYGVQVFMFINTNNKLQRFWWKFGYVHEQHSPIHIENLLEIFVYKCEGLSHM
jgi:hypothetical protein